MNGLDLNCDLGERDDPAGRELENQLLPLVTSVNVACGGHAGSLERMAELAEMCREAHTAFGAHPSFPDRIGFGRRELILAPERLLQSLREQIQMAASAAAAAGIPLAHVKPHGALYNLAAENQQTAEVVIAAIQQSAPAAALIALAGSPLVTFARNSGLVAREELFADRGYAADGKLLNRKLPGALIEDPLTVGMRVRQFIERSTVTAVDGTQLKIHADTICVHSDTAGAIEIVRSVRNALQNTGHRASP